MVKVVVREFIGRGYKPVYEFFVEAASFEEAKLKIAPLCKIFEKSGYEVGAINKPTRYYIYFENAPSVYEAIKSLLITKTNSETVHFVNELKN